ncbi:hypothetical protein [Rufibacter sp. LB8]|uniref:hypothetical protein n=1 Tax=Rufibacter sp. LB8 TaxID=2777781 RepID=UPI00178C62A8|nr:hypothetical protein [Rufibacter sp. LB8]
MFFIEKDYKTQRYKENRRGGTGFLGWLPEFAPGFPFSGSFWEMRLKTEERSTIIQVFRLRLALVHLFHRFKG